MNTGRKQPSVEALNGLLRHLRRDVLRTYRPDSCVFSVRLLIEVLEQGFGLEAKPRAVTVDVFNRWVSDRWREGAIQSVEQLAEAARSAQGWSVGIRPGPAQAKVGGFGGHLVAVLPHPSDQGAWLVLDPSIDQAARPMKAMEPKPMCFLSPHGFEHGEGDIDLVRNAGCLCRYEGLGGGPLSILAQAADWMEPTVPARATRLLSVFDAFLGRGIPK